MVDKLDLIYQDQENQAVSVAVVVVSVAETEVAEEAAADSVIVAEVVAMEIAVVEVALVVIVIDEEVEVVVADTDEYPTQLINVSVRQITSNYNDFLKSGCSSNWGWLCWIMLVSVLLAYRGKQ